MNIAVICAGESHLARPQNTRAPNFIRLDRPGLSIGFLDGAASEGALFLNEN